MKPTKLHLGILREMVAADGVRQVGKHNKLCMRCRSLGSSTSTSPPDTASASTISRRGISLMPAARPLTDLGSLVMDDEVSKIAALIDPDWPHVPGDDAEVIRQMAQRVYDGGYRRNTLRDSQIANCHKEIFKLREELLRYAHGDQQLEK